MPRPILKPVLKAEKAVNSLRAQPVKEEGRTGQKLDKMHLDRLLRQRRSSRYLQALAELDVGGPVQNQAKVEEIIHALGEEFPEVELHSILLGIVSSCQLGVPYEVHTLDITGQIIQHYKRGQPLPGGLEKARSLALRGGYAFIEVYPDCCRAVNMDGSVAVIPT